MAAEYHSHNYDNKLEFERSHIHIGTPTSIKEAWSHSAGLKTGRETMLIGPNGSDGWFRSYDQTKYQSQSNKQI
jgi:hypothetical protein